MDWQTPNLSFEQSTYNIDVHEETSLLILYSGANLSKELILHKGTFLFAETTLRAIFSK